MDGNSGARHREPALADGVPYGLDGLAQSVMYGTTRRARPSETEAVSSGNGVLKLHLSQGFLSKLGWPQICETAKRS